MKRTLALAAAVTLLAAGVAAAQQRPRQAPAPRTAPPAAVPAPAADSTRAAPMGRGMETGGLAGWLASNPAGLDLTADQLARIRTARDEVVRANAPLRAQLQAAYAGRDWRAMAPDDRRALMDSTRGVREQLRANLERGRTTAIGILTPAQQQTLDRSRPNWRSGGPGGAMRGGRGGRMMMRRGVAMGGGGWMRPSAMRGAWPGMRAGPAWWGAARVGPAGHMGYRMGWRAGARERMWAVPPAQPRMWMRFRGI